MRAIHSISSLASTSGGPSYAVASWLDALVEHGLDCELLYLKEPGAVEAVLPTRARSQGFAATRLGNQAFPAARFAHHLRQLLNGSEDVLVHDHGLWAASNYVTARVARAGARPLVVSTHGMLEPWALANRGWKKKLALMLYQARALSQAALICVTTSDEALSVRRAGFLQPIAVVPIGTHIPEVVAAHENAKARRQLLFLSRIHPKKGLLNLVEAWATLRPPDWEVLIAGPDEGGHRQEVQKEIDRLGMAADFRFPGELRDAAKAAAYLNADLFVLPTHSENFGMVIPEAMAHGLPVVTTRGTPWSVLEGIEAGWWVEPNVTALVRALKQGLALTPVQRAAMGLRGRAFVQETLGWAQTAALTAAAYEWVLRTRDARPAHVHVD